MGYKKQVPMDDNFQEMLVYAVRYALGRRTYAVSSMVNYILPMIPSMDSKYIKIMYEDIGSRRVIGYGDEFNEREWLKLLGRLLDEREKRFREL